MIVLPLLGLSLAVGAWWAYAVISDMPRIVLPTPPDVVAAFPEHWSKLLDEGWVTLFESIMGFAIAATGGLLLGTLIAHSHIVDRMTYPWLVAFNSIPKVAIAPLLVVWMGFGVEPRITMAALIGFFPVVIATVNGLRSTPADLAELARSLDASRAQVFFKVRFPHALPQIFIGLKVALPLSVIGAVVGEFRGGNTGLGVVIEAAVDKAIAFAAIAVLSAMSVALFYALVGVERLVLPWVKATSG